MIEGWGWFGQFSEDDLIGCVTVKLDYLAVSVPFASPDAACCQSKVGWVGGAQICFALPRHTMIPSCHAATK